MTWERAKRWAALACMILILFLSLLPDSLMVRTGLGKEVEHVIAYAGAGFIFATGWRGHGLRASAIVFALMVVLAGGMEIFQYFSPGRSPSWIDFWASAAGAAFGVVLAEVVHQAVEVIKDGRSAHTRAIGPKGRPREEPGR